MNIEHVMQLKALRERALALENKTAELAVQYEKLLARVKLIEDRRKPGPKPNGKAN